MTFITHMDDGYHPALTRIVHACVDARISTDFIPYMEGIGEVLSIHTKDRVPFVAGWIPPKLPNVRVVRRVRL